MKKHWTTALFFITVIFLIASGCTSAKTTSITDTTTRTQAPSNAAPTKPPVQTSKPNAIKTTPTPPATAIISPSENNLDEITAIKTFPLQPTATPTLPPIPITEITPKEEKLTYQTTVIKIDAVDIGSSILHGSELFFTGRSAPSPSGIANKLYVYNLETDNLDLIATSHHGDDGGICCIEVSDNWLGWSSYFSWGGGWRIYLQNRQTGETSIFAAEDDTNVKTGIAFASISGDKLVWSKYRKQEDGKVHSSVLLYDLTSDQQRVLAEAAWPEMVTNANIDGNWVVWTKENIGKKSKSADIYLYDLTQDKLKRITTNGRSRQARIRGKYIAWREGFQDEGPIVIYNLATDKRYRLTARGYGVQLGDELLSWLNTDGKERIYDFRSNTVDILVDSHAKYGFATTITGRKALLALRPESDQPEAKWSIEIRTYH